MVALLSSVYAHSLVEQVNVGSVVNVLTVYLLVWLPYRYCKSMDALKSQAAVFYK